MDGGAEWPFRQDQRTLISQKLGRGPQAHDTVREPRRPKWASFARADAAESALARFERQGNPTRASARRKRRLAFALV